MHSNGVRLSRLHLEVSQRGGCQCCPFSRLPLQALPTVDPSLSTKAALLPIACKRGTLASMFWPLGEPGCLLSAPPLSGGGVEDSAVQAGAGGRHGGSRCSKADA